MSARGFSNAPSPMATGTGYRIVRLANGAHSVRSLAHHETFHPVVGPAAEAESLYVRQLQIPERLAQTPDDFVVWDVGLGAAANPAIVLQATRSIPARLRLVSFDHTLEPLRFALDHLDALPYLAGLEPFCRQLLDHAEVAFQHDQLQVRWQLHQGDFPTLLAQPAAAGWPKPHAIMFDAFSPAKNPAMWTAPLFARLYELLDPGRPCALPTYSRSTMLRVTLLLAGFFVGVGHAIGEKEETTVAANHLSLIAEPLPLAWLDRARRSSSAEPLWEPAYRQAPLTSATIERLRNHPQFL